MIKLAKFPLLLWVSLWLLVLTHTLLLCCRESDKGLSGSTGLGALPRSLLLLWLCRGEGTGLLAGLVGSMDLLEWARTGSGGEWAEVKGTCSSLGGGYEPEVVLQPGLLLWDAGMRGPTGGQWGQLMNMASCSVNHDEGSSWMRLHALVFTKIHNKCFLLRIVLCH